MGQVSVDLGHRESQQLSISIIVEGYETGGMSAMFIIDCLEKGQLMISTEDEGSPLSLVDGVLSGEILPIHGAVDKDGEPVGLSLGDVGTGKHGYAIEFLDSEGMCRFNLQGDLVTVHRTGAVKGHVRGLNGAVLNVSSGGVDVSLSVGGGDTARVDNIELRISDIEASRSLEVLDAAKADAETYDETQVSLRNLRLGLGKEIGGLREDVSRAAVEAQKAITRSSQAIKSVAIMEQSQRDREEALEEQAAAECILEEQAAKEAILGTTEEDESGAKDEE